MPVEKVQNLLGNEDWVGKLVFYYYGKDGTPKIYNLPFFENPTISESQEANYASYGPIGRAGNLYSYTGSNSRRFSVGFNLTLPHITSVIKDINQVPNGFNQKIQGLKNEMLGGFLGVATDPSVSLLGSINASRKDFVKDFDDFYEEVLDEASEALFSLRKSQSPVLDSGEEIGKFRQKVISRVAQMLGVIRSSTLNHAKDPRYGPPIVRLNFGIAYQDVPCITKSYSIEAVPDGGYDQRTLMPRIVRVKLQLEEARNLGTFSKFDEIKRDSLGGWEVVFDHITTDPGTNFINLI